jgi:hypothetical protein
MSTELFEKDAAKNNQAEIKERARGLIWRRFVTPISGALMGNLQSAFIPFCFKLLVLLWSQHVPSNVHYFGFHSLGAIGRAIVI